MDWEGESALWERFICAPVQHERVWNRNYVITT
jgi:hypothetical protein